MTTREPGARLVFTHGLACNPASTAFLASRPAATITDGLDVLVQLVIEAMTTEPLPSAEASGGAPPTRSPKASVNDAHTRGRGWRSWGLRGPARLGSMVERSRSRTSLKTGSGSSSVRNRPCSFV